MFVLRDVQKRDLPALKKLAVVLDTVNLPDDERSLLAAIDRSTRAFAGRTKDPFQREYMFVLEDDDTGKVVGTSLVIAQHGTRDAPHVFFDVYEKEHYSAHLDKHFRHRVLQIGYNFHGPTEIGGLVVHPDFRKVGKPGKQLSFVRFLLIAMHPTRFRDRVLVELLPKLEEDGRAPLWEVLGRRFTGLSYQEADRLSRQNKEFIQQLFPPGEIYATLFPQKIQDAIGVVGPQSEAARAMLARIGFNDDERIDPFDGGPHWSALTSRIEPIRRFRRARVSSVVLPEGVEPLPGEIESRLVALEKSTGRSKFRAVRALVSFRDSSLSLTKEVRDVLGAKNGDRVATIPFEG